MKIKITLSYDGSKFLGSATQPHKKSVQDLLQNALGHLGIFSPLLMASRTDKGVHASFAIACVKCPKHVHNLTYLKKQINKFTHPFIHIRDLKIVPLNFQVRYDVKNREYRYIFYHGLYNPFLASYVHFYPKIDIQRVNLILKNFIGEHDFKYFSKGFHGQSIREISIARAYMYKDFTIFQFRANGFLRGQIRLIIASVLRVLEGKMSIVELREQIDLKKIHHRSLAPANGLYLSRIRY